jgi:hypothetical protein
MRKTNYLINEQATTEEAKLINININGRMNFIRGTVDCLLLTFKFFILWLLLFFYYLSAILLLSFIFIKLNIILLLLLFYFG